MAAAGGDVVDSIAHFCNIAASRTSEQGSSRQANFGVQPKLCRTGRRNVFPLTVSGTGVKVLVSKQVFARDANTKGLETTHVMQEDA